ncbi:hypothetical protein P170DRAFT_435919 [Aspergillus steynii IBT 23096]|uniref:Phosphatidylglycerol/phosphatidylinositol transfer protein n=1 Tax=Aspergillus steynii IBT 23096 TaxID=1392250 RepID=A0A2I2GD22_9EURO|nr:uncharacterized protein P170DRAFT_435919 [Aspergillus steynii IBT 23096]PLB50737.1 hypothetical protein P170DRAFT_435919 [Aspergillus steynii IBT 23096]
MNTLLFLTSLAGAALAQNARIGLPEAGHSLKAGEELIVQVQRPNSLTGSQEVGVAIGIQSCANGPCHPPKDAMGQILYNGPFKPVYHEHSLPPYENFTVTVPDSVASGEAVIGVAHVSLVGAGPFPFLEVLDQNVKVA